MGRVGGWVGVWVGFGAAEVLSFEGGGVRGLLPGSGYSAAGFWVGSISSAWRIAGESKYSEACSCSDPPRLLLGCVQALVRVVSGVGVVGTG